MSVGKCQLAQLLCAWAIENSGSDVTSQTKVRRGKLFGEPLAVLLPWLKDAIEQLLGGTGHRSRLSLKYRKMTGGITSK